jgi:hypothetical protein
MPLGVAARASFNDQVGARKSFEINSIINADSRLGQRPVSQARLALDPRPRLENDLPILRQLVGGGEPDPDLRAD